MCTQTRAKAPVLAAFVDAGTPWERPTGRQTFLISSHNVHAPKCLHRHMHAYKQAGKRCNLYVHNLNIWSSSFPKSICVYISVSKETSASWTLLWFCSPLWMYFYKSWPFHAKILMHAWKTVHTEGWVYHTHAPANLNRLKHTGNRWARSHTDEFWHHLSGCRLKWDDNVEREERAAATGREN